MCCLDKLMEQNIVKFVEFLCNIYVFFVRYIQVFDGCGFWFIINIDIFKQWFFGFFSYYIILIVVIIKGKLKIC